MRDPLPGPKVALEIVLDGQTAERLIRAAARRGTAEPIALARHALRAWLDRDERRARALENLASWRTEPEREEVWAAIGRAAGSGEL